MTGCWICRSCDTMATHDQDLLWVACHTLCVLPCSAPCEGTVGSGPCCPQGGLLLLGRLGAAPCWGRTPRWGSGSTGRIPTAGGSEEEQTATDEPSAPDAPLHRQDSDNTQHTLSSSHVHGSWCQCAMLQLFRFCLLYTETGPTVL